MKNCELCAHLFAGACYYNNRKNPPIHYIFFTIPIVKYLLLKDSRTMAVFFLLYFKKKTAKYLLSIILLQSRNSTVEMLKLHYKKHH